MRASQAVSPSLGVIPTRQDRALEGRGQRHVAKGLRDLPAATSQNVEGIALEAQPFRCEVKIHTLAHLGLHALARRLQRGADVDEAAVMRR